MADNTNGHQTTTDGAAVLYADGNPAAEAQDRRNALYAELGGTGVTRFGRGSGRFGESVAEEKLRQLQGKQGREMYRQMRLNHPVCAAVLYALGWAMRKVTFKPVGATDSGLDAEAVQFLGEALEDMSFSLSDTMSFIADPMFEQGFSLTELVYKKRLGTNPPRYAGLLEGEDAPKSQYRDGLIGWRKWAPRPATTLQDGGEWQFDEGGGIQGIWQEPLAPSFEPKFIPIERLLHFRTTAAPANNPEGLSVLRAMYWPFYFSSQIAEIEAIGIERDLAGLPVAYMGKGSSLNPNDDNSDYSLLKRIVTNIRSDSMAGVVMPGPKMTSEGQGFLLELLSSTGKGFDTDKVLSRYHKLMALTGMAQFIFLGMENTGALATGRVQSSFFNLALNGWAGNIDSVWTRIATPRLLALNPKFAALKEQPQWTHSDAGVPDLEAMANFINATVGQQVITPDENMEIFLREMAGLPEKAEPVEIETATKPTPAGAQADADNAAAEGQEAVADAEEDAEDADQASNRRAERFATTRARPGNPTFERETDAYQRALEDTYQTWYTKTARDLDAASEDDRSDMLDAALLLLAAQMIRLGRERLPQAVTTGAGNVPPSPETWAALQRALAENEQYINESLIPAIGERMRGAFADPDIAAGGAVALSGVLQTFSGRILLYASPFYMLIWRSWRDKIDTASEKAGQPARIRWVLDDRAHHCPDCLAYGDKTYESMDDMLAQTGGAVPGSYQLADRGHCRCMLEYETAGGAWTR